MMLREIEVYEEINEIIKFLVFSRRNNQISKFSNKISNLVGLSKLIAYNNKLKKLPTKITQLTNLKELLICSIEKDKAPKEIIDFSKKLEYCEL